MTKVLRSVTLAALLVGAAQMLGGCGSGGPNCASACTKLYDECGVALVVLGTTLTKGECVRGCNENLTPEDRKAAVQCVDASSCETVGGCFGG